MFASAQAIEIISVVVSKPALASKPLPDPSLQRTLDSAAVSAAAEPSSASSAAVHRRHAANDGTLAASCLIVALELAGRQATDCP